jgi:hypothetical protein
MSSENPWRFPWLELGSVPIQLQGRLPPLRDGLAGPALRDPALRPILGHHLELRKFDITPPKPSITCG